MHSLRHAYTAYINFGKFRKSATAFVSCLMSFTNCYYLRYFETFWKGTVIQAFVKIFNNDCYKHIRKCLSESCRNMVWMLSFPRTQFLNFFNCYGFSYFTETTIRLIYLLHMSFTKLNTWMLYISMIDVIKFVSDVITSFTLYFLMPKLWMIFTKNS